MTASALGLFAAIVITGVLAGVLFAVQIAQIPVQRGLGARDFVLVKSRFEQQYGPKMPAVVVATLLAPVVIYVAAGGWSTALVLVVIGHVCSAAVLAVTAIYNLPVNRQAIGWDPERPPADWEALRDRWHLGNAIRLPISVAAFGCHAAAAVIS